MVKKRSHTVILTIILLSLGSILACSPTVRYNVMSTIFDDVPNPNEVEFTVALDTLDQMDTTMVLATVNTQPVNKFMYHPPYQQKECGSCHDQNSMGALVNTQPQLCYQCHDNQDQTQPFVHGPAAGGYCTSCHSPHMAEENHLLHKKGNELCFNCHDSALIANNNKHNEWEATGCITCHSPHSSKNRFMLKTSSCTSCHNDFKEDYSFLHGPVASANCSSCHDSHNAQTEHLLLVSDNQLCLNCHNSADFNLQSLANHKHNPNKSCVTCHNPHGGENRFLLN